MSIYIKQYHMLCFVFPTFKNGKNKNGDNAQALNARSMVLNLPYTATCIVLAFADTAYDSFYSS